MIYHGQHKVVTTDNVCLLFPRKPVSKKALVRSQAHLCLGRGCCPTRAQEEEVIRRLVWYLAVVSFLSALADHISSWLHSMNLNLSFCCRGWLHIVRLHGRVWLISVPVILNLDQVRGNNCGYRRLVEAPVTCEQSKASITCLPSCFRFAAMRGRGTRVSLGLFCCRLPLSVVFPNNGAAVYWLGPVSCTRALMSVFWLPLSSSAAVSSWRPRRCAVWLVFTRASVGILVSAARCMS